MRRLDKAIATELERVDAEAGKRFTAPIVCMCGSTRFKQAWISENARLTGEGQIVLSVGLWGHHEQVFPTNEQKAMLDALHKRKIDLCDWVWVLDVGGYIGESTRSEIAYATKLGRPVRYLNAEFPSYQEPIDRLAAENAELKSSADQLSDLNANQQRQIHRLTADRDALAGRMVAACKSEMEEYASPSWNDACEACIAAIRAIIASPEDSINYP